jgi:hypothetical protein
MSLLLKHNGAAVDLEAARCELGRLTQTFQGPWTLTLRRAIAFDEPTDWQAEDSVELLRDGTAVFAGRIKSSERIASADQEHILYTCAGLRDAADALPVQRVIGGTLTARVVYNCPVEERVEEAGYVALPGTTTTAGEIIADVLDNMASALAGIIGDGTPGSGYVQAELGALEAVPPKMVLNGASVDEALRAVLAHAPDFGFTVDPAARQVRLVDFRQLQPVEVSGVGDRVLRHRLDFSTAGCASACLVQGTYEQVDILEQLMPAWDPSLQADWDSDKASTHPDTYGQVWRLFSTMTPAIEGGAVMPQRFLGDGDIVAAIRIHLPTEHKTFMVGARPVDDQHILLDTYARQWDVGNQCFEAATVLARYTYRRERVSGRYPAAGHQGTAHTRRGLERERVLIDEERGKKTAHGRVDYVWSPTTFLVYYEFLGEDQLAGLPITFPGTGVTTTIESNGHGHITLAEEPDPPLEEGQSYVITVQDDTRKEFEGGTLTILEKYAKETLERVMDERFVGAVPLAGLDWSIALGQAVSFTDTNDPEYAGLEATLLAVEHDLARERTTLSLTSDRAFGATVTWDELEAQRRGQRAAEENAIQIRRLWRRLRARRAPEGPAGDPHEEPPNGPYTGDDVWVHVDEPNREIEHIGPGPVHRVIGGFGEFIRWIHLDARGHVVDAESGTFS